MSQHVTISKGDPKKKNIDFGDMDGFSGQNEVILLLLF